MEKSSKFNRSLARKRQSLKSSDPKPKDNAQSEQKLNSSRPQMFASVHRPRHSTIKRDQQQQILNPIQLQNSVLFHQQMYQHQTIGQTEIMNSTHQGQYMHQFQLQPKQMINNGASSLNFIYVTSTSNQETVTTNSNCGVSIRENVNDQESLFNSKQISVNTSNKVLPSAVPKSKEFFRGRLPSNERRQSHQKSRPTSYLSQKSESNNLPEESLSKIPMGYPRQNHPSFNQISKNATNLLNDIYEKHLLSKTTFENNSFGNSQYYDEHVQPNTKYLPDSNNKFLGEKRNSFISNSADDFNLNTIQSNEIVNSSYMNNDSHQSANTLFQNKEEFNNAQNNIVYRHQVQLRFPQQMNKQQCVPFKPACSQVNGPKMFGTLQTGIRNSFRPMQNNEHEQQLCPKFISSQNNSLKNPNWRNSDTFVSVRKQLECPPSPIHLYETVPEHPPFRSFKKRLPGKTHRFKATDANLSNENPQHSFLIQNKEIQSNCCGVLILPPPPTISPPPLPHENILLQHKRDMGNFHQTSFNNLKETQYNKTKNSHQKNEKQQKEISVKPPSGKQVIKQQEHCKLGNVMDTQIILNSTTRKKESIMCYPKEKQPTNSFVNNNESTLNTRINNSDIQNIRGIPNGADDNQYDENSKDIQCKIISDDSKGQTHQRKLLSLPLKELPENEIDSTDKSMLLAIDENPGVAKFQYRNNKIDLMAETAQAMAAAAYYARAAQKVAQNTKSRSTDMTTKSPLSATRNGGYCGALQRSPPTMPPGLARRLANKENYGVGKVKVMLRVADIHMNEEMSHFMSVDKKKRQVTLTDPTMVTANVTTNTPATQDRAPMVAAPKMFAFDNLFTAEDQQYDVCSSALSEVIPAVLEGSDGCLLTIGYPSSGQSRTMLGAVNSSNELGAIPCAISWLYKGINERRQKSGSRFSVRVSALGISATKPDSTAKDLLAAHATDSDDSPGVYLRDDFLGGPTELRAPTAERAALFLDAALAARPQQQLNNSSALEPAMIFTLHVYQYSLSRKGGVAGGRSRLHLIDLGGCANRIGGLPLSGIGNILLAILSGQKHTPNKDHPLTPLLKDCLAPLTCHVSILAHVAHTQSHTDALTTIQLASRIHRMRRRKHRFPISSDKTMGGNAGNQSGGSSEGPDPSSSDLSADTVIYMGPLDDATDGEHPPVYLPSLSSGDNRCAMNKALKGSGAEKQSKIPAKKIVQKPQSPVTGSRTNSLKRGNSNLSNNATLNSTAQPIQTNIVENPIVGQIFSPVHGSPVKLLAPSSTSKIVGGALRLTGGNNKAPSSSSPKGSPLRRPSASNSNVESPLRKITEEQWIDGPRLSRAKVAEARHLLREINHVKQCETWVDGPKSATVSPQHNYQPQPVVAQKTVVGTNPPPTAQGYGFMDSHKKTMIRQWVENQSTHIFPSSSPTHQQQAQIQQQQIQQQLRTITYHLSQYGKQKSDEDQTSIGSHTEMINPIGTGLSNHLMINQIPNMTSESCIRAGLKIHNDESDLHSIKSSASFSGANQQQFIDCLSANREDEEDQDSGPSEVPPALPLITPLGSREISHESLHRIISRHTSRESLAMKHLALNNPMMDCGLQVTEEEIAKSMMNGEHPLAALSNGDISVVSSFNIGDAFSDCAMGERSRNQFDQLARLREIFTSQLAMAEVTPPFRMDAGSVYSEPAFRFNNGAGSVCSEPPYRPPSPRCGSCHQSLNASRSPSQTSLPSLNGIMTIAGMEQYASLRHPDGASDPNLPKIEKSHTSATSVQNKTNLDNDDEIEDEKTGLLSKHSSVDEKSMLCELPIVSQSQLPLLPLNTSSEAYDSGHDSSTPRTSKHSGISRRAESGYHSVATARDSDESSFTSTSITKEPLRHQTTNIQQRITIKKKRQDKSLCNWLRSPFTCTYPETEGEISDF